MTLERLGIGSRARLIIALALAANLVAVLAGIFVFLRYEAFRQNFSDDEIPILQRVALANEQLGTLQLDLARLIARTRSHLIAEETVYREGRQLIDRLDGLTLLVEEIKEKAQHEAWLNIEGFEVGIGLFRDTVVTTVEMMSVDLDQAQEMLPLAAREALEVNREAGQLMQQIHHHMVGEGRELKSFLLRLALPLFAVLGLAMAGVFWSLRQFARNVAQTFESVQDTLGELRAGKVDMVIAPAAATKEAWDVALSLETLQQGMKDLVKLRTELETKVLQRTEELRVANHKLAHHLEHILAAEGQMRLYKRVFDNTSDGIVITDLQGTIVDVNPAYELITGYTRDESVGRNPRLVNSGLHELAFYKTMWRDITQKGGWSGEIWDKRRNGEVFPALQSINTIYDEQHNATHYLAVLTDITQIKETEKQLEQMAYFDRLTGLPNRRLLMDRLDHALKLAARSSNYGAVLFLDLDHFKNVNDSLGHKSGDELLAEVARRIKACVRTADTVGRLAGDEFVVLAEELSIHQEQARAQAVQIARKVVEALKAPYMLDGREVHCSASVGVALFCNEEDASVETLVSKADIAMYEAKKAGRASFAVFEPAMWQDLQVRVSMENRLREALREDHFHLLYQPVVDVQGRIISCEALVRWKDPELGIVLPKDFISLAEETHLIVDLEKRVLELACRQLKAWNDCPGADALPVAVNISSKHFARQEFVPTVKAILEAHAIDPSRLKIEITESDVMDDFQHAKQKIRELQALGIQLAMDDFGTGYSSLAYLRDLPFDQIKIDRSFVRNVEDEQSDRFIVHSVLTMASFLEMDVVAEGVETTSQREALIGMGCRMFQGYLFSQPVSAPAIEALVAYELLGNTSGRAAAA